jgi:NADH-quinone oxidoreductase subunit K
MDNIPVVFFLWVGAFLFATGFAMMVLKRNTIFVLMGIELMLNAVNLLLVAFSTYFGKAEADAQIFVFFIMVVAAAEVAVGLALMVSIYRNIGSIDINVLNKLKW